MKYLAIALPLLLVAYFFTSRLQHPSNRAPSSLEMSSSCYSLFEQIVRGEVGEVKYQANIAHPDLYLWDNFGYEDSEGVYHVYAMAASKKYSETERHFHAYWHYFVSRDQGKTWLDKGAALSPSQAKGNFDSQSIWSGTVTELQDGRILALYTGLENPGQMKQSIGVAISLDGKNFKREEMAILSHESNLVEWEKAGYYLDRGANLGSVDGEVDGTIQALRDPFPLQLSDGSIHVFFAAKKEESGKVVSAIGHAVIEDPSKLDQVKLLPPILPPDTSLYNQIELPNVVEYQPGKFAWIVSTKRRLSEAQPEIETEPAVRMYYSDGLEAPLRPYKEDDSLVMDGTKSGLYGMTVINGSLKDGEIRTRLFVVADGFSDQPFTLPATQTLRIAP